jgi:hypothetical protein
MSCHTFSQRGSKEEKEGIGEKRNKEKREHGIRMENSPNQVFFPDLLAGFKELLTGPLTWFLFVCQIRIS